MPEQVTDPELLSQLSAPSSQQVADPEILKQLNAPASKGIVSQAIEPITSYPETYAQMNRASREQMGRGIEQMTGSDSSLWERTKGAGNTALGAAEYALSPINAGLRAVVGKPIENVTGIPKEYSEFAAGLALPGVGLPRAAAAPFSSVPSAESLLSSARAAYKSPEVAALKIHPEALPIFGRKAAAVLENDFDPLLAPKTFGLLEKRTQIPEGAQYVTAKNLDTLRKLLGEAAGSADKTERNAARSAMRLVDDFMAGIPDAAVMEGDAGAARQLLTQARGNYAAAMRTGELNEQIARADRKTSRTGWGGNWENYTRQKVSEILDHAKKGRGLSAEEERALQGYVDGNFTRNSLRVATKWMGGDNPLMAAIHGGLAFPTHGLSLAAPITGYALKLINDSISARELGRINELLRSRSPLAEETRRAITNWSRIGQQYALDPNTRTGFRTAASARFLADRLKASGIDVDPGKLILQGPGVGQATENGQTDVKGPENKQKNGGIVSNPSFAHGGRVNQNGRFFHPVHIGAKRAKDGKWYLPDPSRDGKYLRVNHGR